MRERYGASERAQKLKYHVQTSGRSLHAQEMSFNDIRTTLQALCAIYDNCNSLHTNAFDEAVTTPTAESVRRAMAIQLDHQPRVGPRGLRQPAAGQLRRRRAHRPRRGGRARRVRAAQRARRGARRDGARLPARAASRTSRWPTSSASTTASLPIVGVNTFLDPDPKPRRRLDRARALHARGARRARSSAVARSRRRTPTSARRRSAGSATPRSPASNTFEVLMDAVRCCTLGRAHRDALRGRRAVPAQPLSASSGMRRHTRSLAFDLLCRSPGPRSRRARPRAPALRRRRPDRAGAVRRLFVGTLLGAFGTRRHVRALRPVLRTTSGTSRSTPRPRSSPGRRILGVAIAPLYGTLVDRYGPVDRAHRDDADRRASGSCRSGFAPRCRASSAWPRSSPSPARGMWSAFTVLITRIVTEEHRQDAFGVNFWLLNIGIGLGSDRRRRQIVEPPRPAQLPARSTC